MRLGWEGVEWGESPVWPGHYFYYFIWWPNWLAPANRHFWISRIWYDGPHVLLGFWYFNIGWSTPWTLPQYEYCDGPTKRKWAMKPAWWRWLWDMEEYVE